jgi:hypothetical protein
MFKKVGSRAGPEREPIIVEGIRMNMASRVLIKERMR